MDKEIEIAKSWFVAAQICIIFAGFLFASGGIAWSNSVALLNSGFSGVDSVLQNTQTLNCSNPLLLEVNQLSLNATKSILDLSKIHANTFGAFFYIGCALVMTVVVLFFVGRHELRKIR
jgi:TRAP-type C4-dicarboxylate transport system permease small subunit